VSDESGRFEIYVRPFPGPGEKWPISLEGGNEPVWPRNGRELFYRAGDTMMAVDVQTTPTFSAGKPRKLFERAYERSLALWANYDAPPDGQRLLMVRQENASARATHIKRRAELARRVEAKAARAVRRRVAARRRAASAALITQAGSAGHPSRSAKSHFTITLRSWLPICSDAQTRRDEHRPNVVVCERK
jgi:hypothetical protein